MSILTAQSSWAHRLCCAEGNQRDRGAQSEVKVGSFRYASVGNANVLWGRDSLHS